MAREIKRIIRTSVGTQKQTEHITRVLCCLYSPVATKVRSLEQQNKLLETEIEALKNRYLKPSGLRLLYEEATAGAEEAGGPDESTEGRY